MIDFKNYFGSSISRNGIQKIMKKWQDESAIQDLHRGRSGRKREARTEENIAKVDDVSCGDVQNSKFARQTPKLQSK